ncbi:MAG: GntR family transcriptional regulator [Aminobacterium colombiense]|nr:GntR family transcriptional regulator [Aminobacterium colombiense]
MVYQMEKKNLASQAYDRIKKGILSLEFPPGSSLQERALAEELGVSRTPVREAVHRLSQEGWITVNSRRNIEVRSVSPVEIREVFQARWLLERDALDLIFSGDLFRQTGRHMTNMLSFMKESQNNLHDFILADQSFHAIFFQILGNSRLQRFWNSVSEEMIWLGMLAMNEKRYEAVLGEHGRVVEALIARRKRDAKDALQDHLEITEDVLIKKIETITS